MITSKLDKLKVIEDKVYQTLKHLTPETQEDVILKVVEKIYSGNLIKLSEAFAKVNPNTRKLVIDQIKELKDMQTSKLKTFTWDEISQLNITKSEFASHIGITDTFDTALPQSWLEEFVHIHNLSYYKVLYSTFAVYPKAGFGMKIVSGWDKVNSILNLD